MLNPYASQLGDLDPVEVIAATPIKLRSLIGAIGGERAPCIAAPHRHHGKIRPRDSGYRKPRTLRWARRTWIARSRVGGARFENSEGLTRPGKRPKKLSFRTIR